MEANSEYFCSDCDNPVGEIDSRCSKCGAELTGIIDEEKLSGLEGWLLIPLLWLVVGPIVGTLGLIVFIKQFPFALELGYGIDYGIEIIVQIILLVITLYTGFHFFKRKKATPRIMIFWLKISILLSSILLIIELLTGANGLAIENGKQLFRDIIIAAIWIPYFKKSRRVMITFIK